MRTSEQNEQILRAFGDYNVKGHNGGFMIWVMYEGKMYTGAGAKVGHSTPLSHAIDAFYRKNIDKINEILNPENDKDDNTAVDEDDALLCVFNYLVRVLTENKN